MVINLNGIKKEIPDCYEKLTTRQYERILNEWDIEKPIADRDYFNLFQIFCDTEFKAFENTPENETTIWNAVKWFIEQEFSFSSEVPKVLEIKGNHISIPGNVEKLSIGQNIHLKQLLASSRVLKDENGKIVDYTVYSDACAIYLQPLIDNSKFDSDKAKELKKVIEEMPIYLIRPIGFFLLTHAGRRGRKQTTKWQQILSSLIMSSGRTLLDWQGLQDSKLLRTSAWSVILRSVSLEAGALMMSSQTLV